MTEQTEQIKLNIEEVNSTPTIPLNDVQKARLGALAGQLEQARTQGYIESNWLKQAMDLLQEFMPLIKAATGIAGL